MTTPAAPDAAEGRRDAPAGPAPRPAATAWPWRLAGGAAVALAFVAPFSIALTNVALGLLVVGVGLGMALPAARRARPAAPLPLAIVLPALALFAWIAARGAAGDASWPEWREALGHHRELVLLPVVALAFGAVPARTAFAALMAGACVLATWHLSGLVVPAVAADLLAKRITAGFILALCAYVAARDALARPEERLGAWPRGASIALALLFALAAAVAVTGRTGHLMLATLALVLAWQATRGWLRIAAPALALVAVAAVGALSPAIRDRAAETVRDVRGFGAGGDIRTNSGVRLEFWRLSAAAFAEHPAIGWGYGGFARKYAERADAAYRNDPARQAFVGDASLTRLAHPHNEWLYHAAAGGTVGVALLAAFLASPLIALARAGPSAAGLRSAAGVFAATAVACLVTSPWFDFPEGHFVMVVTAILFSPVIAPSTTRHRA